MGIEIGTKSNATLMKLKGRMDAVAAPEFEQACDKTLATGGVRMIVDMGGLEYISSAGLRSVLSMCRRFKESGGKLLICNLSGMVKQVFDISGFSSMLQITDSVETAASKLGA